MKGIVPKTSPFSNFLQVILGSLLDFSYGCGMTRLFLGIGLFSDFLGSLLNSSHMEDVKTVSPSWI